MALAGVILWMLFPFSFKDQVSSWLNVIWSVRGFALGASSYRDMVSSSCLTSSSCYLPRSETCQDSPST